MDREAGTPLQLRLYVSGDSARSLRAVQALETLAGWLRDAETEVEIEVIDVLADPDRAEADRIVATPTLIKASPGSVSKLIGELLDPEALAEHLGVRHLINGHAAGVGPERP